MRWRSNLVWVVVLGCGCVAGWFAHDLRAQPAVAALQGQTLSGSGKITSIAVCFGTLSPPAGWSTAGAVANTLAAGGYKIVAALPATAPNGCANPQIVWAETP